MKPEEYKDVESILFKPCLITDMEDPSQKNLVIITSLDVNVSTTLGDEGEPQKDITLSISALDVRESVVSGELVNDGFIITDIPQFLKNISTEVDIFDHREDIMMLYGIMFNEFSAAQENLNRVSNVMRVVQNISKDYADQLASETGGKIDLSANNDVFASIVFDTINGLDNNIDKEDLDNLVGVINGVVVGNMDADLDSEEKVKKIHAELEYKLIEALPSNITSDKITISMSKVLEQIKKFQEDMEKNDEL